MLSLTFSCDLSNDSHMLVQYLLTTFLGVLWLLQWKIVAIDQGSKDQRNGTSNQTRGTFHERGRILSLK